MFSQDFREFIELLIKNKAEYLIVGGYAPPWCVSHATRSHRVTNHGYDNKLIIPAS